VKIEEKVWFYVTLGGQLLMIQKSGRPFIIVYGIMRNCKRSFQETDIERAKISTAG